MATGKDKNIIESGVLHMKCGERFGQVFTDLLRETAWDDCKREKAILMGVDGLCGISSDQVRQVIDGKMKFVTISNGSSLEMVKDNWIPPDFKEMNKEIDRVLAFISYWGGVEGDIKRPRHPLGGTWFEYLPERQQLQLHSEARDIHELRSLNIWKAHNRARMLEEWAFELMKENAKRTGEAWEHAKTTSKERDEAFYKKSRELKEYNERVKRGNVLEQFEVEAIARIASSDLPEEDKRRLIQVSAGQARARHGLTEIQVDPEFKYDTGWVDRNGIYYGCTLGEHIALSDLLAEKYYPDKENPNPERLLESEGWLKCSGGQWHSTEKKPTKKQIDTVLAWTMKWAKDGMMKWNSRDIKVVELEEEAHK